MHPMRRYALLLFIMIVMVFSGCALAVYELIAIAADERKPGTLLADEFIQLMIREAFQNDDAAKFSNISPFCFNGSVYLVGEYETEQEKERILAITGGVKGVKSVEQYLLPKVNDALCRRSKNLALTSKVKIKLIWDKDTSAFNVHVKSVQCRVVLLGTVSSQHEIDKAISDAKATEGVREVISFLQYSR
jgi:hyperosmotically inducible protein